jgi:hypothetical protein
MLIPEYIISLLRCHIDRETVVIGKNVIPVNRSPEHSEGECEESLRSLPLLGTRISRRVYPEQTEGLELIKSGDQDLTMCKIIIC